MLIGRVGGQRHAPQCSIRGDLVRTVPILAVHVVRDDNLRLIAPEEPGHMAHHAVIAPALLLVHAAQRGDIAVRERAEVRIIALAADPQAVEQLEPAVGRRRDEVRHLHGESALARVVGDRAAHEEDLVVRVGGDEQQVGLFQRGLPLLHPVGRLALAEDVRLREDEPVAVALRAHDDFCRALGQLCVAGQVIRVAGGDGRIGAVRAARLHLERARAVVELNIHAADGLALRRGDFKPCAAAAGRGPARPVIAIRQTPKRRGAGRAHRALRRDLLRRLRAGQARPQQQRAHEQQQAASLHSSCSPLLCMDLLYHLRALPTRKKRRKAALRGAIHPSQMGTCM